MIKKKFEGINWINQHTQWSLYCCFFSLLYWYMIIIYIMEKTDDLLIVYQDHQVIRFLETHYNMYIQEAS